MRFYFNNQYLFLTLVFLAIEIGIALFVNDDLIRPFAGDVLVVILISPSKPAKSKSRSFPAAVQI